MDRLSPGDHLIHSALVLTAETTDAVARLIGGIPSPRLADGIGDPWKFPCRVNVDSLWRRERIETEARFSQLTGSYLQDGFPVMFTRAATWSGFLAALDWIIELHASMMPSRTIIYYGLSKTNSLWCTRIIAWKREAHTNWTFFTFLVIILILKF
jgi:hypothetical protein